MFSLKEKPGVYTGSYTAKPSELRPVLSSDSPRGSPSLVACPGAWGPEFTISLPYLREVNFGIKIFLFYCSSFVILYCLSLLEETPLSEGVLTVEHPVSLIHL
jgi:hypothetical protein